MTPYVVVLILWVENMKKSKIIIISICISVVTLLLYTLYQIQHYKEYVESGQFYIDEYENEKNTENLFKLCLHLSDNDDMKLLDYLDTLINSSDFNEVCIENVDFVSTDYQAGVYKNAMITSAFKICILQNDVEMLEQAIDKYYLQFDTNFSHTYYLSTALNKNTDFSKTHSNEIIQCLENLYFENNGENQLLTTILSYYIYIDDKDKIEIYSKEWPILYGTAENASESTLQTAQEFLQLNVDCWAYAINNEVSEELQNYSNTLDIILSR